MLNFVDAWRQLQVWLVQISVCSVGGITQILLGRVGSGRWTILLILLILQLTNTGRWLSK